MKTCRNCGFINTDDCLFCEKCGQGLAEQQKRKSRLVLVSAACVLFLAIGVAVFFFVFRDKLPVSGKKETKTEETVTKKAQAEDSDKKSDGLQEEELPAKPENGEGQEGSESEGGRSEDKKEKGAGTEADINGVDQAYVQAAGTIMEQDGSFVLKLPEPCSVCAFNEEDVAVRAEDVTYFMVGSGMEKYAGAEVSVKGRISARGSGQFVLEVVSVMVDVEKEAAEEREPSARREEEEAAGEETDSGNHHYSLIVADVTWQEAFDDCISRGGYLLQINSEEEYQSVIQMIEAENKQGIHFYLGGRRDIDSREYYWVDKENELSGELLNPDGNAWSSAHWMEQEPSFTSEEDQEMYMNMIFYQDSWVLNDVPMDITVYYPGKTGYICEFDR